MFTLFSHSPQATVNCRRIKANQLLAEALRVDDSGNPRQTRKVGLNLCQRNLEKKTLADSVCGRDRTRMRRQWRTSPISVLLPFLISLKIADQIKPLKMDAAVVMLTFYSDNTSSNLAKVFDFQSEKVRNVGWPMLNAKQ